METKRYWTDIVEKANQMRKWLDEKPDEYKIGYQCSAGGILNAYREGDLNFDEARAELDRLINVPVERVVKPTPTERDRYGFTKGDKVKLIDQDNLEAVKWGSNDNPYKHLEQDIAYTVKKMDIHAWHTKVQFEEKPNLWFNSVHFSRCSF